MRAEVDIPESETVVILTGGNSIKYHRPTAVPWREIACPCEVVAETASISRLEAEHRGYEPCLRADCFGEPEARPDWSREC